MTDRWDGDALVLSSVDSNNDRILRLLTEDDKVVAAVVRHARRGGKRGAARLQPLSLAHVVFTVRAAADLAQLTLGATEHSFEVVKADLLRYALATSMAEVVLALVHEFGSEEGIYELLHRAWRWLDDPARSPAEDLLLLFELRALTLSGTLPPPESLTDLLPATRELLMGWLEGHWQPLSANERPKVAATLERLIADACGGRRLKSRAFLDQVLAGS